MTIMRSNDGHAVDCIGGIEITDGDRLKLRWPEGDSEIVDVRVLCNSNEERVFGGAMHGMKMKSLTKYAYLQRPSEGAAITVLSFVDGLEAEFVDRPKGAFHPNLLQPHMENYVDPKGYVWEEGHAEPVSFSE